MPSPEYNGTCKKKKHCKKLNSNVENILRVHTYYTCVTLNTIAMIYSYGLYIYRSRVA